MGYIIYKSEENSISVCKGNSKLFDKLDTNSQNDEYEVLDYKEDFNGIKINEFLSDRELDGLKCEERFKKLLEENNIPFLYIGQGPYGIERSGVLLQQTKSKRPDFLLNIPDLGTLLFDVKCRTRIGFEENDIKYFSLGTSELEALYNLQRIVLMPVWLAFYDRDFINNDNKSSFYFLPISSLFNFWKGMEQYFDDEIKIKEIKDIRIPYELLTRIDNKIIFEIGYSNIDETIVKEFAIKNLGFNTKLKECIKQKIRDEHCYKSHISDLIKESSDFFTSKEINSAVEDLIAKKIISYEPRKRISLIGG